MPHGADMATDLASLSGRRARTRRMRAHREALGGRRAQESAAVLSHFAGFVLSRRMRIPIAERTQQAYFRDAPV